MDPITHLASGAIGFQATQKDVGSPKFYLWYCLIAAILPDSDNIVSYFGPEAYLLYHRGITHSLFIAPILALVLAGVYRLVAGKIDFLRVFLVGTGLILLHVLMDVFNSYGTQIFAPFSMARVSLDWVFIVDPILLVSMFALIALGWFMKPLRKIFGVVGLCWILAYAGTNATIKQSLTAGFWSRLKSRGETVEKLNVVADALTPIYWKIIVDKGQSWEMATVNIFDIKDRYHWQKFDKADRGELETLGEKIPAFSTYNWFVRFPYVEKTAEPDGTRFRFGDVRFFSDNPIMQAVRGKSDKSSPKMFVLNALFDHAGKLTSYWFGSRPAVHIPAD